MDDKKLFEQFEIKAYRFDLKKKKYKLMNRVFTMSFPTEKEIKEVIKACNGEVAEVAKVYWMPPFM